MSTTSPAMPVALDLGVALRPYAGLDDLPGMAAANARLRERCGLLEPIDLESIRHRYTHLVNSDPLVDCVIATQDGTTVGYGRVEWHDLADGDRVYDLTIVVDPAVWARGITGALLGWCETRLHEIAKGHVADRRAWLGTFAMGGDTELERTLETAGYRAVRWDAEMLRDSLGDLPPVGSLPPGYAIAPLEPDRYRDLFDMMVVAFRDHWGEQEHGEEEEYRDWIEDPHFDPSLIVVVWHGDDPVACVSAQVQSGLGGPRGYVDAVCTHPDHRRRGLARVALAENLRRLAAIGMPRVYLGVDTDNTNRAFALYEDAGFRTVTRSASYRKPINPQEPAS